MDTALKIGLTYTGSEKKHQNYVQWLKEKDDIEVIRLSAADDNISMMDQLDALVMSGGVDAHPAVYGSDTIDYPNAPASFQPERDSFETAVFNRALELKLPVLAICRGMQLVNCLLGGDLVQDIGPEGNDTHRSDDGDEQHEINIIPGTLLHTITQKDKDLANSAHHQCVNRLGKGLMINAVSEDGIIEGYEWEQKAGKPLLLGVQWHPERMYQQQIESSILSKNIREYFIATVMEQAGTAS